MTKNKKKVKTKTKPNQLFHSSEPVRNSAPKRRRFLSSETERETTRKCSPYGNSSPVATGSKFDAFRPPILLLSERALFLCWIPFLSNQVLQTLGRSLSLSISQSTLSLTPCLVPAMICEKTNQIITFEPLLTRDVQPFSIIITLLETKMACSIRLKLISLGPVTNQLIGFSK